MIQRKQSIFLFMVAVLMSWMTVRPYADIDLPDGHTLILHSFNIRNYSPAHEYENVRHTFPLGLLVLVTGFLNFGIIFFYQKRLLQIRLVIVSSLLLTCMMLAMLYYYASTKHSFEPAQHMFRMAAIFPAIGLVLNFLAYRGINQDEELVKSYDRIR